MKNSKFILIAIAIVIVVGIVLVINNKNQTEVEEQQIGIEGEPIDTAMDFYDEWLAAINADGKDPYSEGLAQSEMLTTDMQSKLVAAQNDFTEGMADPILCQTTAPSSIRSKIVSEKDTDAQILILGPRKDAQAFALVKLSGVDGKWKISDVSCDAGETAPEVGEYNFDQEGYLLKQSVKPPLDPNNWYVVYEADGVMGFTGVLLFNENSSCLANDGSTVTCGDESFYEAMKVQVKGNVNEAGIEVAQIEILQ